MRYRFYLLDALGNKVYLASDNTHTKDVTKAHTASSPGCAALSEFTYHVEPVEVKKWYVLYKIYGQHYYATKCGTSGHTKTQFVDGFATKADVAGVAVAVLLRDGVSNVSIVQE